MKLYELRRGEKFVVKDENPMIPPGAPDVFLEQVLTLGSLDGMYSYCYTESGDIVHLSASANVKLV